MGNVLGLLLLDISVMFFETPPNNDFAAYPDDNTPSKILLKYRICGRKSATDIKKMCHCFSRNHLVANAGTSTFNKILNVRCYRYF